MRHDFLFPALLLAGLSLTGCGAPPSTASLKTVAKPVATGTLTSRLAWPAPLPPFRAQSLPNSTASVTFTVTASDISTPISTTLDRSPSITQLQAELTVPAGDNRILTITAYNAGNTAIASGSQEGISVFGGATTIANVTLGIVNPPLVDAATNGTSAPTESLAGSTVTITGSHFGSSQLDSLVTFNGFPAPPADIVSWGDTQLQVKVPVGSTSGDIHVTVDGITSNPYGYTVDGNVEVTAQ